jgi:hypothetical protein
VRRLAAVAAAAGALLLLPLPAYAHGIGGRKDLPVPLEFFLVGAAVVLAVSFGALAVMWPSPRLQDGPRSKGPGRRIPPWLVGSAQGLGIAVFALVVAAALFGDPGARSNIAPVAVWVLFWLVIPFTAAVMGNTWSILSPWRTSGKLLRLDGPDGAGFLGVWPAAAGFFAFAWMELVSGRSAEPRMIGIAAVGYFAYMLVLASRLGVDRTVASFDAFGVYNRLISAIAPFGRRPDGRVGWRGWLRALPVLPEWPGMVAFAVAMIGTVTFDGLSNTPWWDSASFSLVGTAQKAIWFRTLSLLAAIALIGLAYLAASWVASRIARMPGMGATAVARSFAHTLVPIALAYAVAHYFTLIMFEGQLIVPALSDPLGLGWNLFHTIDFKPNYTWLAPRVVWYVQVAAIVGGHLIGVVLAHDRALAVFPSDRAVRTQYAMLALMVALTTLGLTVLAV